MKAENIINAGMKLLREHLGAAQAEIFISEISKSGQGFQRSLEITLDTLPTASDAMASARECVVRVSELKIPGLIIGEEGLGKSDFAKSLHLAIYKEARPFVEATHNTTPESLRDLAVEADGGSLFLKNIDQWPLELTREIGKLLTTKNIVRKTDIKPLNARLIFSAKPILSEKVRRGEFPQGLYSKMSVMPIYLAPLRERREDIILAALYFAKAHGAELGKDITGFSEESQRILESQTWRGNALELKRAIELAVAQCPEGLILKTHLASISKKAASKNHDGSLRKIRAAYSRDHVLEMLKIHGNSVEGKRKAAKEMGISLATLYRILGG